MSSSDSGKGRKKREKKDRKEKKEREKAEKLAQMMKKRDDEEKELYEPKAITDKGYKLDNLGELGLGALSIVYKIRRTEHNQQDKFCAAKVIDLEQFEDTFKVRFIERHLAILKLVSSKHESIIPVYDVFQTPKRIYIMMEYAVNGTVADYINSKGPVPETQAKKWTVNMLRGLNYLHTNGVAHRNMTEHLLLDQHYHVKLTGFSFSRPYINPQSDRLELSETNCGLGPYFAPEVICGEPYNPKIADVWSVGAVVFMILNKRYPFDYKNVFVQMNQQESHEWRKKFRVPPSEVCIDFLAKLFDITPSKRVTVRQALDHPWLAIPENTVKEERDDIKEDIKKLFTENQEQVVQVLSKSIDSN